MEKYLHVKSCDSTQDLVKEQLSLHPTDNIIASCDHQMNGHGRGQKKWIDSDGTLCFSLSLQAFKIPSFTAMELAVIVCQFFHQKNKKILLKWPNDLINLNGKKCGGILLQSFAHQYIAGIGLNLFFNEKEFGGVFDEPFSFSKKEWAQELGQFIRDNRFQDSDALKSQWMHLCSHHNQQVQIIENEILFEGKFIGLGPYGEAQLQIESEVKSIFNGTLRLV